jgi:7-carboxy-7-deazaguanine synthase
MTAIKPKVASWPVVEIFGPTIQGEGVDQGVAAHFVRFGGCDYRCDWCDTPHAVIPAEVRKNATKMDADDIGHACRQLDPDIGSVPWIILTGGNPGLHDLSSLITELHESGYLVAVETQGSRWRKWMRDVDRLCVSPKPPSSGMATSKHESDLQRFLHEGMAARIDGRRPYEWMFLKIPIFTDDDLDFASLIRRQLSDALLYLSAGNDAGRTVGNPKRQDERSLDQVRGDLCDQYEWLLGAVMKRPDLVQQNVICQLQAHVLAWGNELGH